MNDKTQIHLGDGDNLQDSTKYQNVEKVVLERKQKSDKKTPDKNWWKYLPTFGLFVFVLLLVFTAKYWVKPLCLIVKNDQDSYQAFKSLKFGPFDGSQLCESHTNP